LDDISQAKSIVDNLTTSFTYPVGQKRSYSTSSKAKKISKVGMLGARGYVGQEVIKVMISEFHYIFISFYFYFFFSVNSF